jgi:hypothetical protein
MSHPFLTPGKVFKLVSVGCCLLEKDAFHIASMVATGSDLLYTQSSFQGSFGRKTRESLEDIIGVGSNLLAAKDLLRNGQLLKAAKAGMG